MIEALKTVNYNKELINMLLKSKPAAAVVGFIGPIIYYYMFYNFIPQNILLIWIFIQVSHLLLG